MALFGQEHGANLVRKPIYKRAWFWGAVLILAAFSWYLQGYFEWKGGQIEKNTENILAYTYWQFTERQQKALEEQYKKDTYGGSTPEETLRLFIEALEKKDYELAAKYFIPEKQAVNLNDIRKSAERDLIEEYIGILKGKKIVSISDDKTRADLDFYQNGEQIHFGQMILNTYTGKWKIVTL